MLYLKEKKGKENIDRIYYNCQNTMIGKYIQKQRERLDFSQNFVASKLGISRPTYINIEQETRDLTLTEIRKLANLFNISIEDLLAQKPLDRINVKIESESSGKQQQSNIDLRISIPQKNFNKFREVLLYILTKVGAKPNVGETVLYKLLYFIDFDYYEKFEEQIIGATYMKNHHGPTPVEFQRLIKDMVKKEELVIIKNKYFNYDQKKYLAVRQPDLSKLLNARELQHIDEVLARLSDKNASELSDYSHQDVPWIVTEDAQPIDYETVFYRTPKTSVRNYDED